MRYILATLALAATSLHAQMPLTARDSALHAVQRLSFGATPGLVDSIARTGVMRWIDAQLGVDRPGDPRLRERERAFEVLQVSPDELLDRFLEARRDRMPARRQNDTTTPGQRPRVPADPERRARRLALGPEVQQVTLVRAAHSQNQLAEVMADFWFNHFNVYQNKGLVRVFLPDYVEHTIRAHALGRFGDLLLATARSPAMLFYLDNVQSVAPGSEPPRLDRMERARRAGRFRGARADSMMRRLESRRPTGLNENYARELLELHTLGVDGGYTQQDVTEVARLLTGWGIKPPRQGAGFQFHQWAHQDGKKTILGSSYGTGEGEGKRLLALLALHPSTLHHVSSQLCLRLVSDQPPDGCVDAAVAAWKRSRGEIREVVRAIVYSDDFWASASRGSKIKTPLEFVVSAVRAVGGEVDSTPRLAFAVGRLGQPIYQQSAPTGYPETQADWVNSGALLARMNLAVALAGGRLPGVDLDLDRVVPATPDHETLVRAVDRVILQGQMTDRTREVIRQELSGVSDPIQARALAIGLALGGPEFQRQ